jgi:hypothetical protein
MSDLRHTFNAALAVAEQMPPALRAVEALRQAGHPDLLERAQDILRELRELTQRIESDLENWP